ncbi:MAG TPA: glycoside hydrolase family 15 protein, partial [Pyrinomonadaceae bacterium]
DAAWPSAGKTAVGTSDTPESKVWFTLRGGVMDEVYYPTVDVANTQALQLVVVSADGRTVETEADDATHRVELLDPRSLSFRQINTARSGAWTITKTYTTDPARPTVLIDVEFKGRGGERLYVYLDPSLANSGMHDSAWSGGEAVGPSGGLSHGAQFALASDADKASALAYSPRPTELGFFGRVTNGYAGTSDGLTELRRAGRLETTYARAADGNVVQVAEISADVPGLAGGPLAPGQASDTNFTLALGFGRAPEEALKNARQSLLKGFERTRAEYEYGWRKYVSGLRRVQPKYQRQFDVAAMVLKAHEDKTFRGAMIASLSTPWGGGASANEPVVGGYHLVWSRDLYQVATAFLALGDKASAERALDYLFRVQQKPDGSFPQNSWLDGRPFWGSLQLDEVAYPLILAHTLGRADRETWAKHVKPAADFVVARGPYTPQERWEEESGYSPSTVAAEIAGLVCAAEIAGRNGDEPSAFVYLAAADEWARNAEAWMATSTGRHGDGNYYLRVTENTDPDDGEPRELNNGAGTFDEREVVDAGFLELIRLGVRRADDPLVAKSLRVVERAIKVGTPNGPGFYRYNRDGYGEMDDGRPWNFDGKYTGRGRLWALLSGERGQYELARGQLAAARARLDHMAGFANEGLMIPEQVWDSPRTPRPEFAFGEGTGSATPLAWSMAQFIRLAVNLEEGRNLDTPGAVAARYVKQAPPANAGNAEGQFPDPEVLQRLEAGTTLRVGGPLPPGTRLFASVNGEARELMAGADGRAELALRVPAGEATVAVATIKQNGATGFARVTLRGRTRDELRAAEAAEEPSAEWAERIKMANRSPIVESGRVTFMYRGTAARVEVVGDFTGWSPRGLVMRELPKAGVKYLTRSFSPRARVEYKLIADGEWIEDPLNPNRVDNGVGGFNNFFAMPGYRPASGDGPGVGGSRFAISAHKVPSRLLGGERDVQVYLPADYADPRRRFPVLYLQDGMEYVNRARAVQIADRLIAEKRVAPFVIVFVNPADRMKEYWASDAFADFMATELVPWVDARYRTVGTRDARALLGASLGSTISYWTALRHPGKFARVGGQSSAFWIDDERVVAALARLEPARGRPPFRFYLDAGRLESPWAVSRRVRVMLRAKGYPVTYREFEAGHNWTAWRDQLAEALVALWQN